MNSKTEAPSLDAKLKDQWNAFVAEVTLKPTGTGRLSGYRFAAKDVFHINGYTSGAGNPDWLRTHLPARKDAVTIQQLLQSGAELVGTTHTDELMFSLNGQNAHYGTPVNPSAPDRIPGGSSSGSAVAVAAGMVDFALGTDTGGSVRVPSAYCGIYGFRPTHDAVSAEGVIPLAESFDTVGWMARDMKTMVEVASVLLIEENKKAENFKRVFFSEEAWKVVDERCYDQLMLMANYIANHIASPQSVRIAEQGLESWMSTFRTLQSYEIWKNHGAWITDTRPSFGPGIAERFQWASTITSEQAEQAKVLRQQITEQLEQLLGEDGMLIIPTTPSIAPLLTMQGDELELRRQQTLQLTSIAGLTGLPQLTLPAGLWDGVPIAVSIIAGKGQDLKLLKFAERVIQ